MRHEVAQRGEGSAHPVAPGIARSALEQSVCRQIGAYRTRDTLALPRGRPHECVMTHVEQLVERHRALACTEMKDPTFDAWLQRDAHDTTRHIVVGDYVDR